MEKIMDKIKTAKERFYECGGDEEKDAIERLIFFLSFALDDQDRIDVEEFLKDVYADRNR